MRLVIVAVQRDNTLDKNRLEIASAQVSNGANVDMPEDKP